MQEGDHGKESDEYDGSNQGRRVAVQLKLSTSIIVRHSARFVAVNLLPGEYCSKDFCVTRQKRYKVIAQTEKEKELRY